MSRMPAKVATAMAILALVSGSCAVRAADDNRGYPEVILCEVKGTTFYGYLDRVEASGRAYYVTPSGKRGATIVDGIVKGGEGKVPTNCSDKPLKELIENGQARFMSR